MPTIAFYSPGWPVTAFPNGIVTYIANMRAPLRALGYQSKVIAAKVAPGSHDPDVVAADSAAAKQRVRNLVDRVRARAVGGPSLGRIFARGVEAAFPIIEGKCRIDLLEVEESFGASYYIQQALRVPVVVRLHGPWFLNGPALGVAQDQMYQERVASEGRAIRAAKAVTAPSQDVLDAVRKRYGVDLPDAQVIFNPGPVVPPEQRWSRATCDRNKVLFIGRFDRHKGGDLVVDAFAELGKQHRDVELLFVGPDRGVTIEGKSIDLPTYVASRLTDPQIRDRFHWLGAKAANELAQLRRSALVTIVASRYENLPMTVVEALAFGSPLVAAETGGIKELVRHERTGLLFHPGDARDLAENVSRLLQDPAAAERLAQAARDDYEARLAPAVVAQAMSGFYDRVLGRR